MSNKTLTEALRLRDAGFSVVPIALDGSKAPAIKIEGQERLLKWGQYKERRAWPFEIESWFRQDRGLAVIGGPVSGNLECLDFDSHTEDRKIFGDFMDSLPQELVQKLVVYSTPKAGWRVCWRSAAINKSSAKPLAKFSKTETIIELLSAAVILCPEGHVDAHPAKKPYEYLLGNLATVPTITESERTLLILTAHMFHEYEEEDRQPSPFENDGERPDWNAWDDFDKRATWEEVLEPYGWEVCGHSGEITHWRRPGKTDGGGSATTNYRGNDLFHVFSSGTILDNGRSYKKSVVLAWLKYGGDLAECGKELARQGYGRANQINPFD